MKPFTRIGVSGGDGFVKFNAQTRSGGGDDISFFPLDGFFQNFGMKTAPCFDALLDQEIRAAGVNLYVRRALDRPTVEMRRDLSIPVKETIIKVGFVFLMMVVAFVLYNDITKVLG